MQRAATAQRPHAGTRLYSGGGQTAFAVEALLHASGSEHSEVAGHASFLDGFADGGVIRAFVCVDAATWQVGAEVGPCGVLEDEKLSLFTVASGDVRGDAYAGRCCVHDSILPARGRMLLWPKMPTSGQAGSSVGWVGDAKLSKFLPAEAIFPPVLEPFTEAG